MNRISR